MMIRNGSIDQLKKRGINPRSVDSLKSHLSYYNNYTFVNKNELDRIGYVQTKDPDIRIIEKKRIARIKKGYWNQIINDPNWLKGIERQSKEWGVTLDSAIQKNVDYLFKIGETNQ